MKLLIAFAAVLTSAVLTVPTVSDVTASGSADARLLAFMTSEGSDRNNA